MKNLLSDMRIIKGFSNIDLISEVVISLVTGVASFLVTSNATLQEGHLVNELNNYWDDNVFRDLRIKVVESVSILIFINYVYAFSYAMD